MSISSDFLYIELLPPPKKNYRYCKIRLRGLPGSAEPCWALNSGSDAIKTTTAPHDNADIILKRNTTGAADDLLKPAESMPYQNISL